MNFNTENPPKGNGNIANLGLNFVALSVSISCPFHAKH